MGVGRGQKWAWSFDTNLVTALISYQLVFSTRSGNKIVVNKQKIAIMTFANFEKRPFSHEKGKFNKKELPFARINKIKK